ncbi:hypothetical protein [Clostridium akagii]|uniref:hypothetical protein n=1 Tax=Clostridium akagii TaxID=91623 RepID=UPI00047971F8|nr:hypothetical protein [Clostridium akagii]
MDGTIISYSIKAKAHELAIIKLKSQNLSETSPTDLANQYLKIYNEVFTALQLEENNDNKLSKAKKHTKKK